MIGFPRQRDSSRRRSFAPRLDGLERRDLLATYTVTNTSADVNTAGSLPWAVRQANYTTKGLDFINFDLPSAGPKLITINETLFINDHTVISGKSQPGYAGSPVVTIRGGANVPTVFLLQNDPSQGTTSSGSTIEGLAISSYTSNAVTIFSASSGNWIQDNWLGFDQADGTVRLTTSVFAPPDRFPAGVGIQSSFNVVRGNTISGVFNGVNFGEDIGGTWTGTEYKTNSVANNRIGTDPDGQTTAGYGNLSDGIFLGAGARENFLGPGNVLSGNDSAGIELLHPSVRRNVIFRNAIGTNARGDAALGNGELGVLIANGANANAVGGPFGGNFIAANRLGGVAIGTAAFGGASGNYVQSNVIGLNGAQTGVLGVQNVGITIDSGSRSNVVEANAIAGHEVHGILMANTQSNFISGNWIGRASNSTLRFRNKSFGVALLAGASFNFVVSNAFGDNTNGPLFVDQAAVGNVLQAV